MSLRSMFMIGVLASPAVLAAPSVPQDLGEAAMNGTQLTAAEAETLERQLAENPQSLSSRAQLIGYYYPGGNGYHPARHAEHLLWFIRNAPESEVLEGPLATIYPGENPDGYLEAKKEWLRLVENEPEAVILLRHAARFFGRREAALSASLLERAEALEPTNPHWARQLGELRWREAHSPFRGSDVTVAAQALLDFERAYKLSGTAGRARLMSDLAVTAFTAGNHGKARSYAEAMLETIPNNPSRWRYIHYGNLVLGRIALSEGNLKEAGNRLLAAGRTLGSPVKHYRGPDMALAKALLDRGESEAVLQYLDLCLDLWERGREELKDWIVLIEAGRIPDFDRNFLF